MGQTQKPTTLGYAEIAARMATAGDAAGACVKSIVGLTGACTAAEASTFANPGGATKLAANGFTLISADTVGAATGTVTVNHVFTWTGTQSVSGFAIENDTDDVVFMECCFNAALEGETDDTLTIEATMEFKLGA
jgi:hypothetical protein